MHDELFLDNAEKKFRVYLKKLKIVQVQFIRFSMFKKLYDNFMTQKFYHEILIFLNL